ncbi:MAG: hypothetical protein BGN86_14060 [Caulobacterales bacterium 68-7]|nr:MAG: hypothetical protein BGN86_14060 [Caulobacterales bacterium 68-7]
MAEQQAAGSAGRGYRVLLLGAYAAWFALVSLGALQDFFAAELPRKIWMLDLDSEDSVYTWLSQLVLALCSLALFDIGVRAQSASKMVRSYWFLLSAAFLVLSMDEMLSFHEKLNFAMAAVMTHTGYFYLPWVLPALAVCLIGLVACVPFVRRLPKTVAALFLISGAIYISGAVGMEMIAGHILSDNGGFEGAPPIYRLEVAIEEGLEGLGALLFLTTLVLNKARLIEPSLSSVAKPWRPSIIKPAHNIAA